MDPFLIGFACGALFGLSLCGLAFGVYGRRKSRESWRVIHRKEGF